MAISVFDMFSAGIGPSSSHTVGATGLRADDLLPDTSRVHAELFGSLGATGHGHGSDRAVILGLSGEAPESVEPSDGAEIVAAVRAIGQLRLLGEHGIAFAEDRDLVLHRRTSLPLHPTARGSRPMTPLMSRCARGRTTRSAAVSFWTTRQAPAARSNLTAPRWLTRSIPRVTCSQRARPPGCPSTR